MEKEKIIFATGNIGKLKELEFLLSKNRLNIKLLSLNDLPAKPVIIENGSTFIENAMIKAETVFNMYKLPVIADDSGIIVEELGEPGVLSARYAGENASDEDNNKKLIKKVKSLKNKRAYFECALVFIDKNGKIYNSTERCYGEIIDKPRGNKGFGYDPIFLIPELNKTMAELELNEKNKISHRGKAFKKLLNILRGIYG